MTRHHSPPSLPPCELLGSRAELYSFLHQLSLIFTKRGGRFRGKWETMKMGRVSPREGEEPGATQQSKRSAVRNWPSVSSPFLERELTKAESRGKQSSVGKRGPEPQVGGGERWLLVEATMPWLGQVLVSAGVEGRGLYFPWEGSEKRPSTVFSG